MNGRTFCGRAKGWTPCPMSDLRPARPRHAWVPPERDRGHDFEDDADGGTAAAAPAVSLDDERLLPTGPLEWFAVAQTAIPGLLYLPGMQAFRAPIRIGVYAIALVGFWIWWISGDKRRVRHPADPWLLWVLLCLSIMILHPLTNSLAAGAGQTGLYLAIFCPLFWAPGFISRPRQLVRILAILLVCNGLNSVVGVLQVYDPDRWMPRELSSFITSNATAMQVATYTGPDGRRIIRPPGLFDTPGAVCGAGTIAALLGLIFALQPFAWWKRGLALGLSLAGVSAIYLSYVRANMVVTVGMMGVYAAMLLLRGDRRRFIEFSSLGVGLVIVGLTVSTALGGQSIAERFGTLLGEDPTRLYYSSRGQQIEEGFNTLVVEYPFGAGLARWGMMRNYFGNPGHLDSTALWAEVQPNAWILDGGWPLLFFYGAALVATVMYQWRLFRLLRHTDDWYWTAAVSAANMGTLALVFSFVPFATQVGMQFWFLEGVLHGAMMSRLPRD